MGGLVFPDAVADWSLPAFMMRQKLEQFVQNTGSDSSRGG